MFEKMLPKTPSNTNQPTSGNCEIFKRSDNPDTTTERNDEKLCSTEDIMSIPGPKTPSKTSIKRLKRSVTSLSNNGSRTTITNRSSSTVAGTKVFEDLDEMRLFHDEMQTLPKTPSINEGRKNLTKTSSSIEQIEQKNVSRTPSPFEEMRELKNVSKTSSPFDDSKDLKNVSKTQSPFDDLRSEQGKCKINTKHCQALHQQKVTEVKGKSKEITENHQGEDKTITEGKLKDEVCSERISKDVMAKLQETQNEKMPKVVGKSITPTKLPPKDVRSSIPRFSAKVLQPSRQTGSIIVSDAIMSKKTNSPFVSKIPKGTNSVRTRQTNTQLGRKGSTPNRSRASATSTSTRQRSPEKTAVPLPTSSSVQAKSTRPSKVATANIVTEIKQQTDDKIHNMCEDICSALNKMREFPDFDKDKEKDSLKVERKALDVIMPAKTGAGETVGRHYRMEEIDKSPMDDSKHQEGSLSTGNFYREALVKRNELLTWLSDMTGQSQLNLKEFNKLLENYRDTMMIHENNDMSAGFHKIEEGQIELVQKLIKVVSQLYEEREQLKDDNARLLITQDKHLDELGTKLSILENENKGLLENLQRTTANLAEERAMNSKKKNITTCILTIKQKLSRAEQRMQSFDRQVTDLNTQSKKLEMILKSKESTVEDSLMKVKSAENLAAKLKEENDQLRAEMLDMKEKQGEKFGEMIQNSKELKDAREELVRTKEHLAEEITKGERIMHDLQETSIRLHSMETKCTKLGSLVEIAKNEVSVKENEFKVNQEKLEEEVNCLKTELQARKVMLKVAEDEASLLKTKLDKVETRAVKDQKREKESSELEVQLKTDLALRDEQITQLQEQLKDLVEKKYNKEPASRSKHKLLKIDKQPSVNKERVELAAQVMELEKSLDELAKDNLELQQVLNQKNLELEQRDRIVKMQTDVLKIRDELIVLLKNKEIRQEEDVQRLSDILMEREHAIEKEWHMAAEENWKTVQMGCQQGESRSSKDTVRRIQRKTDKYQSESMNELYSTLENKQMQLTQMQRRIQELENIQDAYNQQRTRQEARINRLELALSEKCVKSPGLIPVLAQ